MSKEEKYYISKDDLWEKIREFYEGDGNISEELGVMIKDIAEHLMTGQNFSGYPYKQEMVSDAILRMVTTISEKKCKLWMDPKCKYIEKRLLRGFKFEGDLQLEEGQIPHIVNLSNKKSVSIFEPDDNHFFVNTKEPAWRRVGVANGVSIVPSNNKKDVVEVWTFIDSGKKHNGRTIYKDGVVADRDGVVHQKKCNAFGYLSLIAHNESITRIKKEQRNSEAIREHQENEFVMFMSDHYEMTPQRIFDDSYEISSE